MFSGVYQLAGVVDLLTGQLRSATESHASGSRSRYAGPCSLSNQRAFQLSQHADHHPHGAACRRRGVDGLGNAAVLYALLFQVVQQYDQVARRERPNLSNFHTTNVSPYSSLSVANYKSGLNSGVF
jgi:hypothetical protein